MKIFILTLSILCSFIVSSQVGINMDGSDPNQSSILDVKSTDKGILIPRMTGLKCQDGIYIWKIDFGILGNDERILDFGHITLIK